MHSPIQTLTSLPFAIEAPKNKSAGKGIGLALKVGRKKGRMMNWQVFILLPPLWCALQVKEKTSTRCANGIG
jgi:hypothetical protein